MFLPIANTGLYNSCVCSVSRLHTVPTVLSSYLVFPFTCVGSMTTIERQGQHWAKDCRASVFSGVRTEKQLLFCRMNASVIDEVCETELSPVPLGRVLVTHGVDTSACQADVTHVRTTSTYTRAFSGGYNDTLMANTYSFIHERQTVVTEAIVLGGQRQLATGFRNFCLSVAVVILTCVFSCWLLRFDGRDSRTLCISGSL